MFNPILRDDNIFKSELFTKDAIAFNVMLSIVGDVLKYPDPKVFSDNKNCIIVNSDADHSVIVWTSDDFIDYEQLFDFIKNEFSENNPLKIMSKTGMYHFLKNSGRVDDDNIKRLGTYKCNKLKSIEYIGQPDNIIEAEVVTVAEMLLLFSKETGFDANINHDENIQSAREFIANPLNKVWRNSEGAIVAMARIRETEKYGRLGYVLTIKEERGKSYAKMLVHFLTKSILETGKTPMLFTNFDYAPSNKCYTAVGYDLITTIADYKIKTDKI